MKIIFNDGGREAAGFPGGKRGDCVARAVAIASGRPYAEVYAALARGNATQRQSGRERRGHGKAAGETADKGIYVKRKWFKDYMHSLGFTWTATMSIGTGCRVHLRSDELPSGRLVVQVSKHTVAMIDGVVHDTHDPARGGTRCVYGYWRLA